MQHSHGWGQTAYITHTGARAVVIITDLAAMSMIYTIISQETLAKASTTVWGDIASAMVTTLMVFHS